MDATNVTDLNIFTDVNRSLNVKTEVDILSMAQQIIMYRIGTYFVLFMFNWWSKYASEI